MSELRIGLGVDAHAFAADVPLVLAGVAFDHPRGLAGHSDGDVIAHALTDALLGAAGLADIGALFPSSDERWRGADSIELLRGAYSEVRAAGYALVNADCVLIGQEPTIASRRDEMRRRLAGALDVAARPRQRSRDDHRPARVHRPGRGARGRGGRAAGAGMKLVRYADRPDLLELRYETLSRATFPEYMHHNEPGRLYWGRLYDDFPDFQVALLDGDELVAEAHAVPVPWDGYARRSSSRLGRGLRPRDDLRARAHLPAGARDQRGAGAAGAAALVEDDPSVPGHRLRSGVRLGDCTGATDAEGSVIR